MHKDTNGEIVDDVSLAFGHPVTINYVRPERVSETASSLDVSGFTASGLMGLMNENEKKNNARQSHQESEATKLSRAKIS